MLSAEFKLMFRVSSVICITFYRGYIFHNLYLGTWSPYLRHVSGIMKNMITRRNNIKVIAMLITFRRHDSTDYVLIARECVAGYRMYYV